MGALLSLQQPQQRKPRRRRGFLRGQWIILLIIIFTIICFLIAVFLIIKNQGINQGSIVLTIVFGVIVAIISLLTFMIAYFQWRYPVTPGEPNTNTTSTTTLQPISQLSTIPSTSQSNNSYYRGILGKPPLSDPKTIEQRERLVKDIYHKLIQSDITAIVLTGIGGVGKSTLAALIYRFAEERLSAGESLLAASSLWLRIDPSVTLVDILGNLCDALNTPLPDVRDLSPQNQATILFNVLNRVNKPRLIVFDQFENILAEDGQALPDRPGIGEWIDALNSQQCTCRILLTSRRVPQGTYDVPSTFLQPYHLEGLSEVEGIELLRKRNIYASDEEMRLAVKHCDGHALSLSLLASLLQKRNLSLGTLLNDPQYTQLWAGQIALKLLDAIYNEQLDRMQRLLLAAFSLYREPVLTEAVKAILMGITEIDTTEVEAALDGLITHYLLQATGEGRYQLHAIVAEYAQSHLLEIDVSDRRTNQQMLVAAHAQAAQYYLQRAASTNLQKESRQKVGDVHDLIESVWQYCQAEMWPEAYRVLKEEEIFDDLKSWGGNATLLELYELLLPLEKWHTPSDDYQAVTIYNNLGRVCSDLENKKRALEYYHDALGRCQNLGNSTELARTLNNLGWIYSELEERQQAQNYFERALKICREIGDDKREASTLNGLGWLYNGEGHKALARVYYEQALTIYRKHRQRTTLKGEGWTLNNLGKIYTAIGDWELALVSFNEALAIRRDTLKNLWEAGRTLKNLGETYVVSGRAQEGQEYILEALRIAKEVGDLRGEGRALDNLGRARLALGEQESALDCFQKALQLHRTMRDHRHEAKSLGNLGTYYAQIPGQKEQAGKHFISALRIYKELGDRWGEAAMLESIGKICFQRGSEEAALACFLHYQYICDEVQRPKDPVFQTWIDELRTKLGGDLVEEKLVLIEPQANQIIERIPSEGLMKD